MKNVVPEAVRMVGICKSFGAKSALNRAELDLQPGEVLGLVGDNGAGKSTLLKILAGVEESDHGDIYVQGEKACLRNPGEAQRLGIEMVYQDLSLCGNMTVWENVFLGRYLTGINGWRLLPIINKRRMARRAARALFELGIELPDTRQPVKNLSGGERQAVAISRAVIFEPQVILLDEPTASMAVREKEKILRLVLELKNKGRSIIMVTHNLPEIIEAADRVLVLKEGRCVWSGPLDGLTTRDLAHMMFAGKANDD